MERDFSVISELKTIRDQKSRLSERENELIEPTLLDVKLIATIYEWFKEIQNEKDVPSREGSIHHRKQFIFLILFLYSPSTLAGGRMPNGLRERIAEAIKLSDITFISHNIENVVFMYQNYKDFRRETEYIYTEIISRLTRSGFI